MAGPERGEGREVGRGLPKVPRIRLRAPSGVHIDYTLPLHETIHHAWRKGELSRVDDDGLPWEGDQYDLASAYGRDAADEGDDGEPGQFERADGINGHVGPLAADVAASGVEQPERPLDTAPKKAWVDFAVAIGAKDADEAGDMTRAQLIELCTPPEIDPLAEGR